MTYYAIIVAGGSGSRMQSEIPKQFIPIAGKPVLMHTIAAFNANAYQPAIIVVLPEAYHAYWKELCRQYHFDIKHQVIPGGSTRFESVKNGLQCISEPAVIAVHDAVRPLVSADIISNAFKTAEEHGSAVTAIVSRDSVRQGTYSASGSVNRDEIFLVQTPQTFWSEMLKKAYQADYQPSFTDDASVVEQAGFPIQMIPGDISNIKITYPSDLAFAEYYLSHQKA
ncbi:2-C-methyl-D-erythritol 4-phosphate cytidylyltransferase [Pedobacter sp. BS3]|uniref:2-C-methyl-D-erythritol 4-phosphate cytidylyltransferase n=1 Tax=Pedobacter sp. BS3 TaxID=2567937 RepID=UPI0011EE6441|nr:2-C-methyl-D-erythritol 4-phosphate cytidylyltransferase [Pedobacter sp. BS3]TZF84767.1 2-C-methyl-D-erythritol 4-phosphate cytidylyltransferase [Pedobacter sp. BS3]